MGIGTAAEWSKQSQARPALGSVLHLKVPVSGTAIGRAL